MKQFRHMPLAVLTVLLLAGSAAGPAMAQQVIGTVPDSQPVQKSVRDMSPEERRAFWNNLPDEDRQRILSKRRAAAEKDQRVDREGSVADEPRTSGVVRRGRPDRWEDLPADRQQGAKAAWESMSDDEKRAFILQHRDEIQAGINARGGQ